VLLLKKSFRFFLWILIIVITHGYSMGDNKSSDPGTEYLYAHSLYQQKAYRRVVLFLHALYRSNLKEPALLNLKAESYIQLYRFHHSPEYLRFAHNTLFKALSYNGTYWRTFLNLGFYYYYKKQYVRAFTFLKRGITRHTDRQYLLLYIRLASRLGKQDDLIKGIEMTRRFTNTLNPVIGFRLGQLYLLSGRTKKAVHTFETLSRQRITKRLRLRIYKILFRIYMEQGRKRRAFIIKKLMAGDNPEKSKNR